jgi:RimJ/RimL family protein N-acetyltransferase
MVKVQLTGKDIILRPYAMKDIECLFSAVKESQPELLPWMPWCHVNYSIIESRQWIAERDEKWEKSIACSFAITDPRDGIHLGGCGFSDFRENNSVANLGYWVRSSRVKQGIATAATLLLAHFGFKELKLNRIEILAAVENTASLRVAVKAGAVREGVLRNRFVLQGKTHDAVMFSLIPKVELI